MKWVSPRYITYGGHRRYKRHDIIAVIDPSSADKQRHSVVYSRVSSHDQKKDLVRQEQVLLDYANEHNLSNILSITDLGSGMNYKNMSSTYSPADS